MVRRNRLFVLCCSRCGLDRQRGSTQLQTSVPDYLHWREYSRSFDELAALDFGTSNITDLGDPMRVSVVRVSANLFAAWQIAPASGRPFAPADNQPGRPRVAAPQNGTRRR